ncbi:transglycosylase SLT domain-containing protein [Heliobacterium undosum]|uniref:Transglycosylase SLT domain-containing protein n=1 Tax=Heliomicrobium undosum TaxID=121734 RepID=A0A845L814_9FIRM|nr:lytic transglycosylase domain-containing protein [Heliomicrobium undosum]MZP29868.1 transglycosylase SLT domain-containing protein [Heliomicrobium undosum]
MKRIEPIRALSIPRLALAVLFLAVVGNLLWYSPWVQKIFYPVPHKALIMKYASEYQMDPYLVTAIIRRESKFLPWAESERGARGLMQLMPQTAEWIAGQIPLRGYTPEMLHDPETNIRMGCWYLANLKQEFYGNIPLTIAAYNGGRGNVRQWLREQKWTGKEQTLELIPFPETRAYVKGVLHDYSMYHQLYD